MIRFGVDTGNLNPMLSYPDINAQSMDVYLYTYDTLISDWVELYSEEFLLKQGALNYAYYLSPDLKPIDIWDSDKYTKYTNGTATTIGLPNTEDVNSEDFKKQNQSFSNKQPFGFPR